jgi:hypothetical protein
MQRKTDSDNQLFKTEYKDSIDYTHSINHSVSEKFDT